MRNPITQFHLIFPQYFSPSQSMSVLEWWSDFYVGDSQNAHLWWLPHTFSAASVGKLKPVTCFFLHLFSVYLKYRSLQMHFQYFWLIKIWYKKICIQIITVYDEILYLLVTLMRSQLILYWLAAFVSHIFRFQFFYTCVETWLKCFWVTDKCFWVTHKQDFMSAYTHSLLHSVNSTL